MLKKTKKKSSNGYHTIIIHGCQAEDVICVKSILREHMCELKAIRLISDIYPNGKDKIYWEIRYFASPSQVEKINNELSWCGIKFKMIP